MTSITDSKKRDPENKDEAIEHISDIIGQFGPMQRRIILYLILIYCIAPFHFSDSIFSAPIADFYCVDIDPQTGVQVNLTNSCRIGNDSGAPPCRVFDHDRTFHQKTLVNTFDLVCEKSWYPSLAQSLHQLGFAVSGLLLGAISDKYGRVNCSYLAIILEIIAGYSQVLAPNIYVYFVARFFIGFSMYGRFLNGYVLIAEWVGPKIRGRMAAVQEAGWCLGDIFLPWIYYFVPNYYQVESTVATVELVLFIGYIFVIKESPRWQLIHGRYEEAEQTLRQAAREKALYSDEEINRRIQKLEEFTKKEQEAIEKQQLGNNSIIRNVVSVWKDKKLLKTALILYFSWFSLGLVGFGAFFNIGNLGGSLHLNVFFSSCSGVVSVILLYFVIQRFDRLSLMRTILTVKAFIFVLLFGCTFHDWLLYPRILFYNISSIAGWLEYGIIYIYTTEFFPTTMRQSSIGICSIFARIGSMIAPFIKELTLATHLAVPYVLFILMTFTSCFLWTLVPNTTDIELPDTILHSKKVEEEDIKRRKSSVHVHQIQN
jgi:OCT family organic cation transporter-like MFS transporter 4/5